MTHQEMTVSIDLAKNSYTVSGRDKKYVIPESIAVTMVTAQSELTGEGQGNIRFFADGSSTGGRVVLDRGETSMQIDINWLTGQIEVEDATRDGNQGGGDACAAKTASSHSGLFAAGDSGCFFDHVDRFRRVIEYFFFGSAQCGGFRRVYCPLCRLPRP